MILNKNNPETVSIASELIGDGAICILPCDTIYGLCAAYPFGEPALKALKGRNKNKPFLVIATLEQAKKMCISVPQDVLETWPAPLSVVLNTKDGRKTAIRVPQDEFLQNLLERVGTPIYSTSVNMSGEPPLLNFTDICNRFEASVDFLVKGDEVQGEVPSTVIDATQKPYKLLRAGKFDVANLIK